MSREPDLEDGGGSGPTYSPVYDVVSRSVPVTVELAPEAAKRAAA